MRLIQIIFVFIFGSLAILVEFKNIKEETIFPNFFEYLPIVGLLLAISVFLFVNIFQFKRSRKIASLFPFFLGCIFLSIIIYHNKHRAALDNSESSFIAHTILVGTDGGFRMDFKKNNHLKAEKMNHWAVTYYWGTYKANRDTIILDIPLDFALRRNAILTDSTLIFTADTVFKVSKK